MRHWPYDIRRDILHRGCWLGCILHWIGEIVIINYICDLLIVFYEDLNIADGLNLILGIGTPTHQVHLSQTLTFLWLIAKVLSPDTWVFNEKLEVVGEGLRLSLSRSQLFGCSSHHPSSLRLLNKMIYRPLIFKWVVALPSLWKLILKRSGSLLLLVLTGTLEAPMPSFVEELVFSFEEDAFEILDELVHFLVEWVRIVAEQFMTPLLNIVTSGHFITFRFIHFLNHVNEFAYLPRRRIQPFLLLILLGQRESLGWLWWWKRVDFFVVERVIVQERHTGIIEIQLTQLFVVLDRHLLLFNYHVF